MISEEQAIGIAEKEITKRGYNLDAYDLRVSAEASTEEYWVIWFEKSGPFPLPGGTGMVEVDKKTGKAILMPGR